jgi:hypothetical protein
VAETFSRALDRVAAWLALGACAGSVGADLWLGSPGDPDWWLVGLLIIPWQLGPLLLAAHFARRSRTRLGQWLFLLLLAAFILVAADAYRDVMTSANSTAAVALVIYPFALYAAFLVVTAAVALAGWRTRSGSPAPGEEEVKAA